ncbi:MAG: HAD family hydrolase [Nanoarchaeota archaeon]|nr:MAG: HAD family hydrolase [Nanoarchaeota archaeon]
MSYLWPDYDVKKYIKAYKKMYGEKKHRLVGGARRTLDYLKKKGYQIYILSSRDQKSLIMSLEANGIHDHFHQIHSGDHSEFHKPDPRVFINFAERFGFNVDESVYVGDLLIDYEGASKAGLKFVAVLTGIHDRKKFEQAGLDPKYIISSVKDIPKWLEKND